MGAVRIAIICGAVGMTVLAGCAKPPATPASPPTPATPATSVAAPSSTPGSTPPAVVAVTTSEAPVSTPVSTTPPPKSSDEDSNAVIGPLGWQTLHLAMTPAEAEALGVADPLPEGDDLCQVWPALGITPLERVIVHPEHGVFAIHPKAVDWLRTPEGMRVGWSADEVAAAYPDFNPAHLDHAHGPTVAVPGNPDAVYRLQFTSSGVLERFLLERDSDMCST
ncbi:hypothetical protein ACTG9Q_09140 [Actinokineospora sp. 24-640]